MNLAWIVSRSVALELKKEVGLETSIICREVMKSRARKGEIAQGEITENKRVKEEIMWTQ